jgi:hypothetical protein
MLCCGFRIFVRVYKFMQSRGRTLKTDPVGCLIALIRLKDTAVVLDVFQRKEQKRMRTVWLLSISMLRRVEFISIPCIIRLARRWTVPFVCALFLSSSMGAAMSKQIRRTTYDGIPLDEPIPVRLRDVLLQIPAGYLVPWPTPAMRNRVNEKTSVDVHFWMPNKRYPEIDPLSMTDFRPREPGREPTPPEAYIVKARGLQPLRPDELGHRSPEQHFRNFTSIPGISSFSFEQEEFGLVRFWRNDWPHVQPEPFLFYKQPDGSDPQLMLRCTPPDRNPPNPICDGYVYFTADQLSFNIVFSRADLPRWRDSVLAVRDLYKSWSKGP